MKITKQQARLFLIAYQSLLTPKSLIGKKGIMEYINKVGSIQFDPLQIVDINPSLVLQARLKDYKKEDLTELLYRDRLLIDDWDKNMCIYPIYHWPYFSRYREKGLRTYGKEDLNSHKIMDEIRTLISTNGPISSQDINHKEKVDWFWDDTKISKAALECLYFWGELVIHHKKGLRKYYDYAKSVLPKDIYRMEDPNKKLTDFFCWIVKRRIGSVGILWDRASDAYLGVYFMKTRERKEAIKDLLKAKEIIEVEIEGIKFPFYIRDSELNLLEKVIDGITYQKKVSFIAPLDNLIWDRKLIKELFNFDYKWEVYKPKQDRKFGYYVLPVLYGEQFIARFEPIFDKKNKVLTIKNWWWEPNITRTEHLRKEIGISITEFSNYLQAEKITWLTKKPDKH